HGTCATNFGPNNYFEHNLVYGNTGTDEGGSSAGICPQVGDSAFNVVVFHGHCATNSVANINPSAGTIFVNWQLNGSGDYQLKAGGPATNAGENTGSNSFVAPSVDSFGG